MQEAGMAWSIHLAERGEDRQAAGTVTTTATHVPGLVVLLEVCSLVSASLEESRHWGLLSQEECLLPRQFGVN